MIERLTWSWLAQDERSRRPARSRSSARWWQYGLLPGLPNSTERRPGAAGPAVVGVVAGAAEAPEIVDGAIARVAQRRRRAPRCPAATGVADVAAASRRGRQRGAALDRAVGLDAERRAPGAARAPWPRGMRPRRSDLVRAEVADVVARPQRDAAPRRSARLSRASSGKSSSRSYGWSSTSGLVGRAAHRAP